VSDAAYTGVENLEAMREAERYNRFLVDLVMRHRSGTGPALDFGAGSGTFAALLRGQGLPVRCLEPDGHLQNLIAGQGLDVIGDAAAIPAGSVDYVYSLNVLEHIEDDRAALKEIHRILRPGGRLLLYVPAFQVLYSSMDERVGHFRRYRRRPLSDLVREAGLCVENSAYADSVGFLAALAYRFLGDESGSISGAQVRIYDRLVFPVSRAFDRLFDRAFGKNVYLIAVKDG
jgi:SAM-dependent methyltransferase